MLPEKFILFLEPLLFPVKLYMLASSKDCKSIQWGENKDSVKLDITILGEECFVPGVFNVMDHKHVFRQLSYYGFYRIDKVLKIVEFKHPNFIAGRLELVETIRRASKRQLFKIEEAELLPFVEKRRSSRLQTKDSTISSSVKVEDTVDKKPLVVPQKRTRKKTESNPTTPGRSKSRSRSRKTSRRKWSRVKHKKEEHKPDAQTLQQSDEPRPKKQRSVKKERSCIPVCFLRRSERIRSKCEESKVKEEALDSKNPSILQPPVRKSGKDLGAMKLMMQPPKRNRRTPTPSRTKRNKIVMEIPKSSSTTKNSVQLAGDFSHQLAPNDFSTNMNANTLYYYPNQMSHLSMQPEINDYPNNFLNPEPYNIQPPSFGFPENDLPYSALQTSHAAFDAQAYTLNNFNYNVNNTSVNYMFQPPIDNSTLRNQEQPRADTGYLYDNSQNRNFLLMPMPYPINNFLPLEESAKDYSPFTFGTNNNWSSDINWNYNQPFLHGITGNYPDTMRASTYPEVDSYKVNLQNGSLTEQNYLSQNEIYPNYLQLVPGNMTSSPFSSNLGEFSTSIETVPKTKKAQNFSSNAISLTDKLSQPCSPNQPTNNIPRVASKKRPNILKKATLHDHQYSEAPQKVTMSKTFVKNKKVEPKSYLSIPLKVNQYFPQSLLNQAKPKSSKRDRKNATENKSKYSAETVYPIIKLDSFKIPKTNYSNVSKRFKKTHASSTICLKQDSNEIVKTKVNVRGNLSKSQKNLPAFDNCRGHVTETHESNKDILNNNTALNSAIGNELGIPKCNDFSGQLYSYYLHEILMHEPLTENSLKSCSTVFKEVSKNFKEKNSEEHYNSNERAAIKSDDNLVVKNTSQISEIESKEHSVSNDISIFSLIKESEEFEHQARKSMPVHNPASETRQYKNVPGREPISELEEYLAVKNIPAPEAANKSTKKLDTNIFGCTYGSGPTNGLIEQASLDLKISEFEKSLARNTPSHLPIRANEKKIAIKGILDHKIEDIAEHNLDTKNYSGNVIVNDYEKNYQTNPITSVHDAELYGSCFKESDSGIFSPNDAQMFPNSNEEIHTSINYPLNKTLNTDLTLSQLQNKEVADLLENIKDSDLFVWEDLDTLEEIIGNNYPHGGFSMLKDEFQSQFP